MTQEKSHDQKMKYVGRYIYALCGKLREAILAYSELQPGQEMDPTTRGLVKTVGHLYDLILLVNDEIEARKISYLEQ